MNSYKNRRWEGNKREAHGQESEPERNKEIRLRPNKGRTEWLKGQGLTATQTSFQEAAMLLLT